MGGRHGHHLFFGEVGRYGCQNDGLDEAHMMQDTPFPPSPPSLLPSLPPSLFPHRSYPPIHSPCRPSFRFLLPFLPPFLPSKARSANHIIKAWPSTKRDLPERDSQP